MTKIALATSVVLLVACASVTDVVATGADTYMVASQGTMGHSAGSNEKAKALQRAGDFCRERNRRMEVIQARETSPGGFGQIAAGEVEFRCLAAPSR